MSIVKLSDVARQGVIHVLCCHCMAKQIYNDTHDSNCLLHADILEYNNLTKNGTWRVKSSTVTSLILFSCKFSPFSKALAKLSPSQYSHAMNDDSHYHHPIPIFLTNAKFHEQTGEVVGFTTELLGFVCEHPFAIPRSVSSVAAE